MKKQSFIALLILLISSFVFLTLDNEQSSLGQFKQWMKSHGKIYLSPVEEFYRSKVFKMNLKNIQAHNQRQKEGLQTYQMGLNYFSDLTDDEFIQLYLNKPSQQSSNFQCTGAQASTQNLPSEFDWVAKSGVSSVRTLGQCKAGYAVATVETIETSYFMSKGGSVKQFSPQQIIDCSSNSGNKGCDSGDVINSISYLKSAGVGFESSYPFKQTQETCKYEQAMKIWEIGQCVKVTSDKELNLKGAVKYQPVAASINADKIKSYKSGVYSPGLFSSCKTSPNHWVTIVGYGVQDSQNFWKVKNSWGTSWGVNGYLFISRKGDGEGVCGIQHQAYFTK